MHAVTQGENVALGDDRLDIVLPVRTATAMTPYDMRFARNLAQKITDEIQTLHTELGNGSQIVADNPHATGMRCTRHVGMIAGLVAALNHIRTVEDEMSGKSRREKGE